MGAALWVIYTCHCKRSNFARQAWWDQLPLSFNNLTGPKAPRYFRVAHRYDLGLLSAHGHDAVEETRVPCGEVGDAPPAGEDIVVVVKQRMSSMAVSEVLRVLPAGLRDRLRDTHPAGSHPRKALSADLRNKVRQRATAAYNAGAISLTARDYLVGWASGTIPKEPRPAR